MTGRTRFAACGAIVIALVASVAAQDALSRRVSLDLKAMAPADAFAALASSAGVKVVVDPAVTAPVDIVVRNVTARTALTTICESIGCQWTLEAGTLFVRPARSHDAGGPAYAAVPRSKSSAEANRILDLLKKPLPANMKFENAPLAQVNERLSLALGMNIALSTDDPGLKTVTIDFSQKSLMAGLKELGEAVSSEFRLAVRIDKDPTGKESSPSIMIAIRKPGQVKK
jgi:type II secretory pathway component GspD/PulD (secretin)